MFSAQFCDFGRNHQLAIGPIGVEREVVLVVFLRFEEGFEGLDRGHNGSIVCALPAEFIDKLLGYALLPLIVVEDYGAVLSAHVITLAIQSGGVVGCKENLENFPK
jgi:hypothetical protein